jgi:hypothetical protein
MAIYLKSLLTGIAALAAYIVVAAAWVLFGSAHFVVSGGSVFGSFFSFSVVLVGGLGLLIFAIAFSWRYRKASRQVRRASH